MSNHQKPNGVAPTFVARFSDGIVTRMTCHCAQGNLDLGRGIVISRAAYESRTKGKEPPPIVEARFQTPDGKILCEYDNSSKAGLKYLSLRFKPKQSNQAKPDIDDEVPW